MPKQSFTLTRRLPSGEEKNDGETYPTLREAAQSAAYVLHYNTRISRREVNRAASRVQDAPLGTWTDAPGGYSFRIDYVTEGIPSPARELNSVEAHDVA